MAARALQIVRHIPRPPTAAGYDATKTQLVFILLLSAIVAVPITIISNLTLSPDDTQFSIITAGLLVPIVILLAVLFSPMYGHWSVRLVGWFAVVVFGVLAYFSGDIFTPPYAGLALPIVINGYINGRRSAVLTYATVLALIGLLIELNILGLLPNATFTMAQRMIGYAVYFGLLVIAIEFIIRELQSNLRQSKSKQKDLLENQRVIQERDRLVSMLATVSQLFLGMNDWKSALDMSLPLIGQTLNADRVFVFEFVEVRDDSFVAEYVLAWAADGVPPVMNPDKQRTFDSAEMKFDRWFTRMSNNQMIYGAVRDYPEPERQFFLARGITSQLSVPLFVDGDLWGNIGFDQLTERDWTQTDRDVLRALADTISAAIRRSLYVERIEAYTAQLQAVINTIPDPLFRVGKDGEYLELYSNSTQYRVFSAQQYIGRRVHDLYPSDTADEFLADISAVLAGEHEPSLRKEYVVQWPNRPTVYIETTITRWGDDNVIAMGRNITDQRTSELRIQASEAKFRTIYEGSPDVMILADVETLVVRDVNPALRRILGMSPDRLIGQSLQQLLQLADDSLADLIVETKSVGGALGQTTITSSDGQRIPIDVAATTLHLAEGPTFLLVLRDTSDRARVVELNRLLTKERELNTLRQQFIQTVSHEFRTPLSVIQLNSEMLSAYGERLTPDSRVSRFEMIKRQVDVIQNMIENVTRYGDALQFRPLNLTDFDVAEFMRDITHDLNTSAETPRIDLNMALEAARFRGDIKQLRVAVMHLIRNSLRYSKPETRVAITVSNNQHALIIRVSDKGVGIPPDFLAQRIFTPFQRAPNVVHISGTGIGLALSRQIIEQHGGQIALDSVLGEGTVVDVVLPSKKDNDHSPSVSESTAVSNADTL